MNIKIIFSLFFFLPLFLMADDITAVTHTEEAADGLDLEAVVQILKDSKDAETLEQALNNPELGINNMDLNDDGYVDYMRVVTEKEGDTHVIILQIPLEENEVQDVATIEIEKDNAGAIQIQVHGNAMIYGPDYYIRPVGVSVTVFPFVNWLFSPYYRPWRPHFYIGFYPSWYHPWRRVPYTVYRPRITRYNTVRVGRYRTSVVVRAPRIYRPRTTTIVKRPLRRSVTVQKKTVTVRKNVVRTAPVKTVKTKKVVKTAPKTTVAKKTTIRNTPNKKVVKTTKVKKTKGKKTVVRKKTVKKKR